MTALGGSDNARALSMANHEIGIVRLATMGQNFAPNLASHGVRVALYNRTRKRTDEFMADHGAEDASERYRARLAT